MEIPQEAFPWLVSPQHCSGPFINIQLIPVYIKPIYFITAHAAWLPPQASSLAQLAAPWASLGSDLLEGTRELAPDAQDHGEGWGIELRRGPQQRFAGEFPSPPRPCFTQEQAGTLLSAILQQLGGDEPLRWVVDQMPNWHGVPKDGVRRRMLDHSPAKPAAGSHIPASAARTPSGHRQRLCSPALTNQRGLGSAAGCTKSAQPGGTSFRSLRMENYFLGGAGPSLLPAGAGLVRPASIPIACQWESAAGRLREGEQSLPQRLRQSAARWDPSPRICSWDLVCTSSS